MERKITIDKIKKRINESEKGYVFILTDFLDLASYDATKKALSRIVKNGELIRVLRGIYKVPNYNDFLEAEVPASPDEIARAIARERNWTIGPKGDAALNILGLTTQVPSVYEYISNGPYKKVEYNGMTIAYNRRSNKNISGKTYKTILVIEGIRTLGEEGINNTTRRLIAGKCSKEDLKLLSIDGKKSSRWIYEEIKKILEMGGYKDVELSEEI